MDNALSERPEYAWLREYKQAHARELLERFGAHALGIGWKRVAGQRTDQPALIFYVQEKKGLDEIDTDPIPASIAFTPSNSDQTVLLLTDVVESPPPQLEPGSSG